MHSWAPLNPAGAEAAAWIRDNARTVQLEYFEYSWVLNRTHGGDNDN